MPGISFLGLLNTSMNKYRLNKYFPEIDSINESRTEPNVLDNHLERVYKKTDKVAKSLEKYMKDVSDLEKRIKDKFENEGITAEEYIKVATSLKLILNRLDDMGKHIESIDSNFQFETRT